MQCSNSGNDVAPPGPSGAQRHRNKKREDAINITLRQLQIFEAVARHGAISRAATALHLTQPAVSMQVKQLEDQIGLKLIEFIGKRLHLTEAGRELRGHAECIAMKMTELNRAMEQFHGLERGVLRLAVVSTANYFLSPVIAAFTQKYPGVRISLAVDNRERVLASLTDNQADLAITGQPPEGGDIAGEAFMDNPLVVVASPGHKLASRPHLPLSALSGETLVLREVGSGTRATVERFLAAHKIAWQPGCELSSNEAVKQAVQAGLGLGVVPRQTIDLELETGRLKILPVDQFPLLRRWFLLHRTDKHSSSAAEAFRAALLAAKT